VRHCPDDGDRVPHFSGRVSRGRHVVAFRYRIIQTAPIIIVGRGNNNNNNLGRDFVLGHGKTSQCPSSWQFFVRGFGRNYQYVTSHYVITTKSKTNTTSHYYITTTTT
jgi:hypothetical protein